MSITDELRKYANRFKNSHDAWSGIGDDLTAIADRIDAEHESACAEAYGNGVMSVPVALDESAWVELPKDANGEYIHVGDVMTDDAEFRSEGKVVRLMLEGEDWFVGFDRGAGWAELSIHEWHHYYAPTVEDVLREFAEAMNENMGMYTGEAIDADEWRMADERTIAKYAAKLRLAKEDA